jgi:hypothetical protein
LLVTAVRELGGAVGQIDKFGIEEVGHYGAGLAWYVRAEGNRDREVGRPNRQRRSCRENPAAKTPLALPR